MRIDRDLVPDDSRSVRGRTVLIGCAVVAIAVIIGTLAGFFIFGWIAGRTGLEEYVGAYLSLGAFWGAIGGGIAGAVIGGLAYRRRGPPSGSVLAPVIVWMAFWLLSSFLLPLSRSCGHEVCREFAGGATRSLLVLEAVILVAASAGSLARRSSFQRWLAVGTGLVLSPALFLGVVAFAPVTSIRLQSPAATALGNVDVRFVAANAQAIVPGRLTKLQLGIQPPDSEVIEVHDITGSDGAFRLALSPGTHRFALMSVKARVFGKKAVDLFVPGPSFEVPANGCVYLGRIVFSFVRLPPGDNQTQYEALIEYIERSGGDPTQEVEWIPVPGGGIYSDVPVVDLPPPDARTRGWEACTIEQATM